MAFTRRRWLASLSVMSLMVVLGRAQAPAAGRATRRLSGRERIRRRHLPNVALIAHTGRRVRFYDDLIKDRKVIINFMYATCDGICTPLTRNLARVQTLLGDRVGRDIFMYSITLKPENDSAATLREYAAQHQVAPGWLFLTGTAVDIEQLRRALGFTNPDPVEDADTSNHVGMVRYGVEPVARWAACPGMANPKHILRSILWDLS